MTMASPPKALHPFCLALGCLDFAMKRHLGTTIIHLPRQTLAYSDLAAEYSGLALQGAGEGHRGHENNKITMCLYCNVLCTTKPKVTVWSRLFKVRPDPDSIRVNIHHDTWMMCGWNNGVLFVSVTLGGRIRILRYQGGRLAISFHLFTTGKGLRTITGWFEQNERKVDLMIYEIDKIDLPP